LYAPACRLFWRFLASILICDKILAQKTQSAREFAGIFALRAKFALSAKLLDAGSWTPLKMTEFATKHDSG
jgi:hypothetical protein